MAIALAPALSVLSPAASHAQAWQCRVPPQVHMPRAPLPDGPPRSVPISGYTLALTWSPEFCHAHGAEPGNALQCSGRMGRFGFVLHGLWPEGRGASPQWCPARVLPDAGTIRRNLCMTPSPSLIVHEWAKHGTCMARSPAGYYVAGAALFGSIGLPDMARLSRQPDLTAGAVRDAFIATNPSLSRPMFRLKLSGNGWLQEVQLCYGRDFMPRRCPGGQGGPDDPTPVKIWRGI